MKNSTKWYNISSPALKCEVAVAIDNADEISFQKKSSHAIWLASVKPFIFPLLLITFILFFVELTPAYHWVLVIIFLCFCLWLWVNKQLSTSRFSGFLSLDFSDFTVRVTDVEQKCSTNIYQLSAKSRVGQQGCWIVLNDKLSGNKIRKVYVAKCSVSAQDFSRLARFVKMGAE